MSSPLVTHSRRRTGRVMDVYGFQVGGHLTANGYNEHYEKQQGVTRNSNNPLAKVVELCGLLVRNESTGESTESTLPCIKPLVLKSGSDHPLINTLDRHRAKYVRDMGWMAPDHLTDFDRYDSPDRWTRSFVEVIEGRDGEDVIVSSFRLTRVEDLRDCMSLDMVSAEAAREIPEELRAQLTEAADGGVLYDLTRLLPPSGDTVSKKEYLASFARLIGLGTYHTAINPRQDPVWIFATTSGFHAMLNRLGVINQVLADERPTKPGKGGRTVLCCVRPLAALNHVLEKREKFPASVQNVVQGIDNARLTPVV